MTISRAYKFLTEDIWRHSQNDIRSKRRRYEFSFLKIITLCARGFVDKNLNVWANNLTFSLMFAAIPMLAMVIAIADGFGYTDLLREKLQHTFLSEYQMDEILISSAQRYLDTAQSGLFLGIGLLILLWAVYSFFTNVEQCFNEIWNVHRSRPLHRQVITYIAIMFCIPILLVVSSGLFGLIWDVSDSLGLGREGWMRNWITKCVPYLTSWVIFSLLYKYVPNTKVGLKASIIPGILMGTTFQLMQWVLIHFVVILARTSIVYGAFATIPMLMMCWQWMCLLILVGTELSFAIQNNENFEYEQEISTISTRYDNFIALYLTHIIVERFRNEQPPISSETMADEYHIPLRLVRYEMERLTACGILIEIYTEGTEERLYQPAKDVAILTIGHVEAALNTQGSDNFLRSIPASMKDYWEQYQHYKNTNTNLNSIQL